MMNSWKETTLGDLVRIKHGYAFKSEFFVPSPTDYVLVTPGNFRIGGGFQEQSFKYYDGPIPPEYKLKQGDLVVTMTDLSKAGDTLGFGAMIPDSPFVYLHNQRVGLVEQKNEDSNLLYLSYLMRSQSYRHWVVSSATGSTVKHTAPVRIESFKFLLPPLPEQRAIASVLGSLDEQIELLRRQNATLERIAQTLFRAWFVEFEPVRAKVAGLSPVGLDAATASLFPDEFEDEAGLPTGWKTGTLSDVTGLLNGYAFKSADWMEEGVPVVKIGSVKPGIVDLESASFVSHEVAERASRFKLNHGDLLVGMTGYVGEVGLVPFSENAPLLNQRVGKFVLANVGTSDLGFLYCFARAPEFKTILEANAHGSAQANISASAILGVPIVIPSPDLMSHFNEWCQPILDKILDNHAQARTLAGIRDQLLPRLIAGDLRVPARLISDETA